MQNFEVKERTMPKSEKNKVYRILADFNGFSHGNDYSIEHLLKALKEANFEPYIDEILGYRKTDSGMVKEYILKFEGFKNHFLVEFYVDDDYKTTEVNFYFTDSAMKDAEMIIDTTLEGENVEVEVKEDFDKFSSRLKTALKRSNSKDEDFKLALKEIDKYCSENDVPIEKQEQLEDELWNIIK